MSISKEQLLEAMDSYGNFRHQIELLKANKETVAESILQKYPDAKKELQELDEELGVQLKALEKQEKQLKTTLQMMIDQFSADAIIKDKLELKSPLLRVGLEKEIKYDAAGLDGYALSHPEILGFRSEKISSRITLNKV